MSTTFLDLLQETFDDVSQLSPEKIRKLVEETTAFFHDLQERFQSGDPHARLTAENAALKVRETLEAQMEKLCKITGLDPLQLTAMAEDPANLSREEKEVIQEMKEKLQDAHPKDDKKNPSKRRKPRLRLKS